MAFLYAMNHGFDLKDPNWIDDRQIRCIVYYHRFTNYSFLRFHRSESKVPPYDLIFRSAYIYSNHIIHENP